MEGGDGDGDHGSAGQANVQGGGVAEVCASATEPSGAWAMRLQRQGHSHLGTAEVDRNTNLWLTSLQPPTRTRKRLVSNSVAPSYLPSADSSSESGERERGREGEGWSEGERGGGEREGGGGGGEGERERERGFGLGLGLVRACHGRLGSLSRFPA